MAENVFDEILARLENLAGPDRRLDVEIFCIMPLQIAVAAERHEVAGEVRLEFSYGPWRVVPAPKFTWSIKEAIDTFHTYFPYWYYTIGCCELTGHATIGPDYNGRHGDMLKAVFPVEKFHEGFSADLAPGGADFRVAVALTHCMVQALKAIDELRRAA